MELTKTAETYMEALTLNEREIFFLALLQTCCVVLSKILNIFVSGGNVHLFLLIFRNIENISLQNTLILKRGYT